MRRTNAGPLVEQPEATEEWKSLPAKAARWSSAAGEEKAKPAAEEVKFSLSCRAAARASRSLRPALPSSSAGGGERRPTKPRRRDAGVSSAYPSPP